MIKRNRGNSRTGRSQSTAYKDLVWVVATADEENVDLEEQTRQALNSLDISLREFRTSKSSIISATVYIADINRKPDVDAVWSEWIGPNPDNWPQRACIGVELGGNWLIEIVVTAVREISS